MPENPKPPIGWYEVFGPDKAKIVDFYTTVFGFETTDMDMEGHTYTMFQQNGAPFCGTMDTSGPEWEGVPPHWLTYFHVPDIEQGIEKVKSAGGTVLHGPIDIPADGKVAICQDDQGATFSLVYEPEHVESAPIQAVNWVEHMSPDRLKAVEFYTKVFGWNHTEEDMGPEIGKYSMLGTGEEFHAGVMVAPNDETPPNWLPYLATEDVHATVEKIKAQGGAVFVEPFPIPEVGTIAVCADPTGAPFGLHQPPAKS